jgi:hypothetical protein
MEKFCDFRQYLQGEIEGNTYDYVRNQMSRSPICTVILCVAVQNDSDISAIILYCPAKTYSLLDQNSIYDKELKKSACMFSPKYGQLSDVAPKAFTRRYWR